MQHPEAMTSIQTAILNWFQAHQRDLPWRKTRDPYKIMVSEIMLQQTQVDRVLPKYQAFLERFPTLEALAHAPTSEVIRAWAGLGYNRRAVNMQRSARALLEEYAGQFPQTVGELLKLPGIGAYTAGAIACFAFEQDVAFMDTNIRRVVRRMLYRPDAEPGDRELLEHMTTLVPAGQGWAWNQAIMELGALICTAARPQCWRCPVREYCQDYAARRQADEHILSYTPLPAKPVKKVAERRESPYPQSSRFYRGRIITALREHKAGLRAEQLGPLLKDDYTPEEQAWVETLLAGLERDGLLLRQDGLVKLPE